MTDIRGVDTRRTISGLHYLRALATMSVVMVHSFGVAAHPEYFGAEPLGGLLTVPAGEIDLFFTMSGFIMVAVTYNGATGLPRISAGHFLLRRMVRILPLLWIAAISYALLRYLGAGVTDVSGALRAMFVWPVGEVDPNIAWTIRHEVLFYLMFAGCFLTSVRMRPIAIAWFLSPLAIYACSSATGWRPPELLRFLTSPFNLEFGLGVLIGFLHQRTAHWRPFAAHLPLLVVIMIVFRVFMFGIGAGKDVNLYGHVLLCMIFCAATIGIAVRTEPTRVARPMIFLGDASYSIFLFHPHVISPALIVLSRFAPGIGPAAAGIVVFAAAVSCGCLVHLLIEKPILKRANLFIHRRP